MHFLKKACILKKSTLRCDFNMEKQYKTERCLEKGQSLVEILAVLAVVGVLTTTGVAAYKYCMDKSRANDIVYNGQIIHTQAKADPSIPKEQWIDDNFSNAEQYAFQYRIDSTDLVFVKVFNVKLGVCKCLLRMQDPEKLNFYTSDGSRYTTCLDTNEMIMTFENVDKTSTNCETGGDCDGSDKYCNHKTHKCESCPTGLSPDKDNECCIRLCNENERTCVSTDGTLQWCCDNLIRCGRNVNECIVPGGKCNYNFDTEEKDENTFNITYSVNVPCAKDQFCNLKWKDENCTGADRFTTGTIYGSCYDLDKSGNNICPYK